MSDTKEPRDRALPEEENAQRRTSFSVSAEELKKPTRVKKGNKKRVVLIGLCAIVVLAGAVWGITLLTKAVVEQFTDKTRLLTNKSATDVADVTISIRDGVTLRITKEDGLYEVDAIAPQVLSQSSCESAFINVSQLLAEDVAAEGITDFAPYGLAEPVSTVFVNFHDGGTLKLEIGNRVPVNPYYYARVDGGDTVYQIKGLLVGIFADGVNAFWDLEAFAIDTEYVVAFSMQREGMDTIELTYESKIKGFRFTQWQMQQPFIADVFTDSAEALLTALNELEITRFVDTTSDLVAYGLDKPKQTVALVNNDGSEFALYVGDRDASGNAYVKLNDTDDVYLAKAASIAWLDQVTPAMMLTEFSNIQAINNIDALTVDIDGSTKHFVIDRSGGEPAYTKDGAAIDEQAFKDAMQAVSTIYIENVTEASAITGQMPIDLCLTYTFTNGEIGVVEYIDIGAYHYALRKNGTVGVVIRKDDAVDMLAAWRAL